ncbi:MAG: asparaginase [Vicinamibacterales bacterium]
MHTGKAIVEVFRGQVVESRHRVHIAVAHAEQGLTACTGNPAHVSFVRSAIKMFQALPLVEEGGVERFGLTEEELAVCTASHGGEPFHIAAARSILAKAELDEHDLACGPHPPMHAPSAEALRTAGIAPSRVHNNCSGKHSGLLAYTRQRGWNTGGYHEFRHPTQQRIVATLSQWMDVPSDDLELAVDGCGLPTFALPLDAVAYGCARFATAAADGHPAACRLFDAMTKHPEYVAGTDRLCSDLMRAAAGSLFAKVGAEGFYCAGVPNQRLGIAIKVEDGATRASEPALLATLRQLGAISDAELTVLARYARPSVLNTRSEVVGQIQAVVRF